MKRILVISALSVAALALAVNGSVGSVGRGIARSEDRVFGRFDYRVIKNEREGHTFVEGRLRFEQLATNTGASYPALVEMGTPRVVGVEGNVCRFAGPGSYTFINEHGRRTVRGTVHGVAVDGRTHEHPEGHDRIEVHFTATGHNLTYDFAGEVGEGDLVVFSR